MTRVFTPAPMVFIAPAPVGHGRALDRFGFSQPPFIEAPRVLATSAARPRNGSSVLDLQLAAIDDTAPRSRRDVGVAGGGGLDARPGELTIETPRARLFRQRLAKIRHGDESGLDQALATMGSASEDLGRNDRVKALIETGELDLHAQFDLLDKLPSADRVDVLGRLNPTRLESILGPAAAESAHRTSPPFAVDWRNLKLDAAPGSPELAWACAVLSDLTYAPFGPSGGTGPGVGPDFAPLAAAGFEMHFAGAPSVRFPFAVAVRDREVLIAFRGTVQEEPHTVETDIDGKPRPGYGGLVHAGFSKAAEEIWPAIQAIIEPIAARDPSHPLKVVATGHSLGAGLAALSAYKLAEVPTVQVTGVYLVGAPRYLNPQAVRAYSKKADLGQRTFRIESYLDWVSQIPPKNLQLFLPYVPLGEPVYLGRDGRARHGLSEQQMDRHHRDDGAHAQLEKAIRTFRREGTIDTLSADHHHASAYVHKLFLNRDVHSADRGP